MKTIISTYSLAPGEIGKPLGEPITETFQDGKSALIALAVAIDTPRPAGNVGHRFLLETEDGRQIPFDSAYEETFGEKPVFRDNRENLYPRLKTRAR